MNCTNCGVVLDKELAAHFEKYKDYPWCTVCRIAEDNRMVEEEVIGKTAHAMAPMNSNGERMAAVYGSLPRYLRDPKEWK